MDTDVWCLKIRMKASMQLTLQGCRLLMFVCWKMRPQILNSRIPQTNIHDFPVASWGAELGTVTRMSRSDKEVSSKRTK
jgi:hypothetical protein